jgi:hypothetical protein
MVRKASGFELFDTFVDDYDTMKTSGVTFQGKQFPLELSAIMCDSSACSFMKNVKWHTG